MRKPITCIVVGSLIAVTSLFVVTSTRSASLEKKLHSLQAQSSPEIRSATTTPKSKALKKQNPVATIQELIEEHVSDNDPLAATAILPKAVKIVENSDIDELLELAKELASPPSDPTSRIIAMNYILLAAEDDPEHTLAFFEENMTTEVPDEPTDDRVVTDSLVFSGILQALAKKDPEAAAEAVRKLPEGGRADRTRSMIAATLMQRTPELAIDLLNNNVQLAKFAAASIGADANDAAIAAKQLGKISDNEMRGAMSLGLLGSAYVNNGYDATIELYKSLDEPDPSTLVMIGRELARGLASTSPPLAITFAESEMSGTEQEDAIASTLSRWARSDFNAAATWLGEQKPSKIRDGAIHSFTLEISSVDPEAAVIWAKEISDPALREKTLNALNKASTQSP